MSYLLTELLTPYFPLADKAPLFIKAFIEQNQDFFKTDPVILDWLSLLETGVVYNQPSAAEEESTNNATADQVANRDQIMTENMVVGEQNLEDTPRKEVDWSKFTLDEVYSGETSKSLGKTPAQEA